MMKVSIPIAISSHKIEVIILPFLHRVITDTFLLNSLRLFEVSNATTRLAVLSYSINDIFMF